MNLLQTERAAKMGRGRTGGVGEEEGFHAPPAHEGQRGLRTRADENTATKLAGDVAQYEGLGSTLSTEKRA